MRIDTQRFGMLEIEPSTIVAMPEGMPGFSDFTSFVLLPADDNDEHLFWMQSTTDGDTAFLALMPWAYFEDYEPELSNEEQRSLSAESAEDLLVLTLLTISHSPAMVTANLLAPVIVNQTASLARQVVLTQDYPTNADLAGPGNDSR
ncbi:MAG: flagellar assembly protein FliW [Acidimicrobiales bacterium]